MGPATITIGSDDHPDPETQEDTKGAGNQDTREPGKCVVVDAGMGNPNSKCNIAGIRNPAGEINFAMNVTNGSKVKPMGTSEWSKPDGENRQLKHHWFGTTIKESGSQYICEVQEEKV